MDNHPIPQDITNFQFRLIGEMTIKQFCFVVAGVVLAWLFLAIPLPLAIRVLLAGIVVIVGVSFAFLPIDGRPLDVMLLQFLKALLHPTQYIYQKNDATIQTVTPSPLPSTPKKKEAEPETRRTQPDEKAAQSAAIIASQHQTQTPVANTTPVIPTPQPAEETLNTEEKKLQQETTMLATALAQAKKVEESQEQTKTDATQAHEKVGDLEKQLQQVMEEKQQLEKQLIALQQQMTKNGQQVFTPSVAQPTQTKRVKQIPRGMQVGTGTPLVPETPNLVTGIIKDARNNVLGNILIEVKDKDGNPVRAFKTNQLGQFAAATPLANGTYTISFEDPAGKQTFDSVEITAQGESLLPLEIISIDEREKLRQELFGKK